MSPTKSFALSSSLSALGTFAAYAVVRLVGAPPPVATVHACAFAGLAFLLTAIVVRMKAGSFTTAASAAAVGGGATLVGVLMTASRPTDAFGLLLVGFVLGIAISVFALTKDLDEHVDKKLLLFIPMALILVMHGIFGL